MAAEEAGGVEELPGGTGVMAVEAGARGVADGADPGAEAGLVPAAVPATADPDPAPTLVPSLAHPRKGSRPSRRLVPAPGPSQGAAPLRPTEGQDPGPGPRASPSLPQIMVVTPHRHQTDEDTPESIMKSKTSQGRTPVQCNDFLVSKVTIVSCSGGLMSLSFA